MSDKVLELTSLFNRDDKASWVAQTWDKYNTQRQGKLEDWNELQRYIFATDTSTTSNNTLPWKNTTVTPKLCQIRDNLHANYESSLFPNDRWLQWEAHSKDAAQKEKAEAIKAYMSNKTREGRFRSEVSKLLYDYIDYGVAIAMPSFESRYKEMPDGTQVAGFIGPKAVRVDPLDIVFNPLASSIENTFKVIRSIKTLGEIKKMAQTNPEDSFWTQALEKRTHIQRIMGGYSKEDFDKAAAFDISGFGNLYEYFQSDFVEILDFYGDWHNNDTGEIETDRVITVMDRVTTVSDIPTPSWQGAAPIRFVGWRGRPGNLWAMGPLDNLVGMQYRIDHLENIKADALDLIVHPPLQVTGEVEEFVWAPGAEIHVDEQGGVSEISKSLNGVIAAENGIQILEDKMEAMAGAPREAAGIRTPGEKTALEVQTLSNAAGRIFQSKVTNFEVELLEPLLNDMLEISARNMQGNDVIRVLDDDFGVQQFLSITKEDVTANGKLRPIGARHFAKEAQDLQNLMGIMNSVMGQTIAPHTSGKQLAKLVDDVTGLSSYKIFRSNVAVEEQAETQALASQMSEDQTLSEESEGVD